jgi:hypothetical protein
MRALRLIGTLAAGVALIAAAGYAQSQVQPPATTERTSGETAKLTGRLNSANRECGTSITVTFDWTGADEKDLARYSAGGWCGLALETIERVCGDEPGKEAVKEKIKRLNCGFGPKRALSLRDDGTVDYKINFEATNNGDFLFEALENAL